jgi:CHAT domain-containing protein
VDGDGLLTLDEVLQLKMDADWVVLSACNTASSDTSAAFGNESGEALSGLGRGFFYAGTRAVLASNWSVETVSAKLITTDIFARQVANPQLGRAEALRQAMLAIMAQGTPQYRYAHPLFWAPFSLIGDGS